MIDPEALIDGEIEVWKGKVKYRAKEVVRVARKHDLQPWAKFAEQLAENPNSREFWRGMGPTSSKRRYPAWVGETQKKYGRPLQVLSAVGATWDA